MEHTVNVPGWAVAYVVIGMWFWGWSSAMKWKDKTNGTPLVSGVFWPVVAFAALLVFFGAVTGRGKS